MMPNRGGRCIVTAELSSSSQRSLLSVPVISPGIYCEVTARPAVLSHRQHGVTTLLSKHTTDSSATCTHCHATPALQSACDLNMLAKTHRPTLWTNKLHNYDCLDSGSHTVSCKNKIGMLHSRVSLLTDESACYQGKCQSVSGDRNERYSRANCHFAITECPNISESLTHVLASAVDSVYMYSGCQCSQGQSSSKSSLYGRLLRGGNSHSRNKPPDSRFRGPFHSIKDEEFLRNLRKAYSRLRKARTGGRSSLVRRRKMVTSCSRANSGTDGLCVVGLPFITCAETVLSTANNLQARNTRQATGRGYCNEANGISLQTQSLMHMYRLQGIIRHQSAAAGALPVAHSDKEKVHMPTAEFPPCHAHLTQEWSPGKISIQLSFHNYLVNFKCPVSSLPIM